MAKKIKNRKFYIELIKPSRYDDNGYVIQWRYTFDISNSLSCLNGLSLDVSRRKIFGKDVDIVVNSYDEFNTVLPLKKIVKRIIKNDRQGLVCLVGVQTNQYARALDIGKIFRRENIQVIIGGFHVGGFLSISPELPENLQEAQRLGISLYAGEAEGKLDKVFLDAYHNRLQPVYNYLKSLPQLNGQPLPVVPRSGSRIVKKFFKSFVAMDTSRGCPFKCSFCTIIHVQGNKTRARNADDVERLILENSGIGSRIDHLFFADDNFARNPNWEAILDAIILLRTQRGIRIKFGVQVDTQAHRIPRLADKLKEAGCSYVFIGVESINILNLKNINKKQNKTGEYRNMYAEWHTRKIVVITSYIIGFPDETKESIFRDLDILKRDFPIDVIWFFLLTPLPGSEDFRLMLKEGKWMEPDMNQYDTCHSAFKHPNMTPEEIEEVYRQVWEYYYTDEQVRSNLKRAFQDGIPLARLTSRILYSYCSMKYEKLHPLYFGFLRRKILSTRRPGASWVNPWLFYPKRIIETIYSNFMLIRYIRHIEKIAGQVRKEGTPSVSKDVS